MFPFAKCGSCKSTGRKRAETAVWSPKRGADRNVVPVFSERLKKFKSNANESEELNILARGRRRRQGVEGGTRNAAQECETLSPRQGKLRRTLRGGRSGGTVTPRISSGLTGGASR